MIIGGMFELERVSGSQAPERPNTIYTMSGRCAIYACLLDMPSDVQKVAYVPAYTCETVLSSYVKAGFSLRFYDVDPVRMTPLFKEGDLEGVGVISICGYYGFLSYDRDFLKLCLKKGIIILQDTTHSITYVDEDADYAAGSLRKWMGIACGGVAVKKSGSFTVKLLPAEDEHLKGRYLAMDERSEAIRSGDDSYNTKAGDTFWRTELRLRKIFDAYASDEKSVDIARRFDYNSMILLRRKNFLTVASRISDPYGWRPVFTGLKDNEVPSHYTLYADDREDMQGYLLQKGIKSTVYWPKPPMIDDISKYPGAKWIYGHVLSIQLDQRYGIREMEYLADTLNGYSSLKHGSAV